MARAKQIVYWCFGFMARAKQIVYWCFSLKARAWENLVLV